MVLPARGYVEGVSPESSIPAVSGRSFAWIVSVVAALGGFLFGYDTGVVSGALLYIRHGFGNLSSFEQDAVVSGLLLGAAIGAVIAGRVSDRIGRRPTIIGISVLFIVGILVIVVSPSLAILIVGRFLVGLAVGGSSSVVIVFLSEVAPPAQRGRIVSANQLMVTAGIVVAYLVDYAFSSGGDWRAMFGVAFAPAALLGLGMLAMPETPRYLASHGKDEDARRVLMRMLGTSDEHEIEEELSKIDRDVAEGPRWRALLAPNLRRVLVVGIGLAILQQITGINTVIYFAPTLLNDTGLGSSNSILNSIPIGTINVIATIVSLLIIDRVGRRPLLVCSLAGMALSLLGLGIAFELAGNTRSDLALTFLVLYVGSFAIGFGPLFWLLISEIYPGEVRGEANSVATAANWLANFAVALTFLDLVEAVGESAVFWGFGVISVLSIVFTLRFVPETRDKSLEDLEQELGTIAPEPSAASA
jgi:sugar porter (SP) family MFS transporter